MAIIPARGGSKRIPKKNIKEFCGKPIIVWSIEAALNSDCFEKIIVSTDDKEISNIAKKYGATVPFIRPKELSDDFTTATSVINHAVKWLNEKYQIINYVCSIHATAPLIRSTDIKKGLCKLVQLNCDYVFPVTKYPFPIQRALTYGVNNKIHMINQKYLTTRSQDLEQTFYDAGQFWWGKSQSWLAKKEVYLSNSYCLELPNYRVQDIDTLDDWQKTEILFKAINLFDELN